MHFLVMLVSIMSMTVHHDCGAVNPLRNAAAWTAHGQVYTARYTDDGELHWNGTPPAYVMRLADSNKGRAIRLQCLT